MASIGSMIQNQWFQRGDDEKFASPEDLLSYCADTKSRSKAEEVRMSDIEFATHHETRDLLLRNRKSGLTVMPTNWGFKQACAMVGAHSTFLEKLPVNLTVDVMNHLFTQQSREKNRELEILFREPKVDGGTSAGFPNMQSLNGAYYGRIWDSSVATMAVEILDRADGRFYSPLDWSKEKRALFRSDRDMHMLYIDGGSIVDGGMTAKGEPDQLNRGFIIVNSEVGKAAWAFYSFLFRWVCGNFAIHGIEDVKFFKVKHTMNGPARFAKEAMAEIQKYVDASPKKLEETIRKAKDFKLPKDDKKFIDYFRHRQFTKPEVVKASNYADSEEGGHETLWQMVNGFTATARVLKHADEATSLQSRAGKLLELVAA